MLKPALLGPVDCAQNALQRSQIDVVIHTDTKNIISVLVAKVDVCHGLGIGAHADGVGLVVHEGEPVHLLAVDGVEESVDGAVALAGHLEGGVGVAQRAAELVERFLNASFLTGTRHEMRLNKVKTIEDANFK